MDLIREKVGEDTGDKMDNLSVNMFKRMVFNSNVGIKTPNLSS